MEKIPMTRAGFDQLDLELRDLKAVERPAVAEVRVPTVRWAAAATPAPN